MSCVGALWPLLPAGSMDLAAQVWPLAVFERGSRAARQHGRHLPQHRARARVVPAQRARLRQASRAARAHLGGKSRASTNCPLVAPSVSGLTWLPHATTAWHGRPTALGRRVRPPAQARLARLARLARSASAHRVPWGWGDEWRLPPAQERTGQSSLPNPHPNPKQERTGQSSLPHVFVNGKSIGGLYSGTPGLAALQQQGELRDLLQEAGAFS